MPELPEVESTRRRIAPAMVGARFTRVRLNRPDLRVPFPEKFDTRLRGQTVTALRRRGKYLLAELTSGDTLVMHLGMSGSFRVEPTSRRRSTRDEDLDNRHDHVLFVMSSGMTVTFNDPRRFGLMKLVNGGVDEASPHGTPLQLGPEPLTRQFDAATLAARCVGRSTAIKVLLLDQRVVAGLGNIYASEALHLARVSPFRRASSLATSAGRPRPAAARLARAIKSVLRRAVGLTGRDSSRRESNGTGSYRGNRFRVYDREGEPCPTPGCRGVISRVTQAGRSTFYCRVCQR